MTTSCINPNVLAKYFRGTLSDKDKLGMMEHLTVCPDCFEKFVSESNIMGNRKLDEWEASSEETDQAALERLNMIPVPPKASMGDWLKDAWIRFSDWGTDLFGQSVRSESEN